MERLYRRYRKVNLMKKVVICLFLIVMIAFGVERYFYNDFVSAIETNDKERIAVLEDWPFFSFNRCGGENWILSFLPEIDAFTPLESACISGNFEVAEWLINKGANADKVRWGHFTPVYLTIETIHENDLEMLKLLIENGADPTGSTSSSDLDEYSLLQISRRLVTVDQEPDDMLFIAGAYDAKVADQSVRIYQYLESVIEKPVLANEFGETVLMNAVSFKNTALVEYLLESGHDVNQANHANETAMFYLVDDPDIRYDDSWRKAIFDLLIEYGVDLTVKNAEGLTAYDYAIAEEDTYLTGLLEDVMRN